MMKRKNRDQYTLADIFREMEIDLIISARKTLAKHESWEEKLGFRWEQWQLAKLRSLNAFRVNNRKIIKSYQSEIEDTIEDVIKTTYNEEYRKSLEAIDDIFAEIDSSEDMLGDIEPIEENFFHVNDEKVNVIIDEMQKTFVNSEGVVMRKMDDTYRQVLDKAVLKMGAGTTTINQAIDESTQEFLKKGINAITYKDGRKVNIASYAEMYLRTANQQATFYAQGKVRDRLKVYTVLMSQHENCSPMCLPYQGTIMIDDVFTSIAHDDAVQLARETGYTRLSVAMENHAFHPNCRHSLSTWFPQHSSKPKPFTAKQNEKAVKRYELEQEQRQLENQVRKWKREEAGLLDPAKKAEATKMARKYQKELRNHVKANPNLRRNYWRERLQAPKSNTKSTPPNIDDVPYEDVTQEWIDGIDYSKEGKITERNYFEKDGVRYDSSNSVLRYSVNEDERKFAEILSKEYHKDVSFVPRVKLRDEGSNFISTPDFYMDEKYWELKTIEGSGRNTILDSIKRGKNQSNNFLLNITEKSNLTNTQLIEQINAIYIFKRYDYVESIIVFRNNKLYLKTQKKR